MWATGPNLDQALEIGAGWGFTYKQVAFVWDKMRTLFGSYTNTQFEFCLVFKKGKIPQPRGVRDIRQAVAVHTSSLGHSTKPPEVRERIAQMFPDQRKIELFSRNPYFLGWDAWGDEV